MGSRRTGRTEFDRGRRLLASSKHFAGHVGETALPWDKFTPRRIDNTGEKINQPRMTRMGADHQEQNKRFSHIRTIREIRG